ncbi:MAG: UDP-glucose 4-epimerase [Thermoprotei archaeon]|nr:MAG: UDP-glucose 4-epimerase [Thermoprotei archaeon]
MERVLVTGGAGFIGSYLVESLISLGCRVVVLDNLSTGSLDNLSRVLNCELLEIVKGDIRDYEVVSKSLEECDIVFHFAANPEVRLGIPEEHYEHNLRGTFTVLEAMRRKDVRDIVFASSSTVYGDAEVLPTPENYAPLKPISVYGASKLGCEALISSYAYTYDFRGIAVRYANVVGPRSRRGVIYDFVKKLRANPRELEILGDGTQTKSYIWIEDAIEATLTVWKNIKKGFDVFNIGSEDAISVKEIADIIVEVLGLRNVKYRFTGGVEGRGWPGDVKYMHLDISKIRKLGWTPKYTSRQAVRMTAEKLARMLS